MKRQWTKSSENESC